MALAVGSLIHLLLDAMWTVQETFLWPAFGWEFPPGVPEYWSGLLERLVSDPLRIVQEAVGLGYLIYVFRKAQLSDPEHRSELSAHRPAGCLESRWADLGGGAGATGHLTAKHPD